MKDWSSDKGATIEKMRQAGRLWVCERLPDNGSDQLAVWPAKATKHMDIGAIESQWCQAAGILPVPRHRELRARALEDAIGRAKPIILVVTDAHLLNRRVINHLLPMVDLAEALIMVGDVVAIHATMRPLPAFGLRAETMVRVIDAFV